MNSDKLIKLVAGVGLFGAWLALVILKMVPAAEFVNALQLALMALGIYHASTQQPGLNVGPYVTGTATSSTIDKPETPSATASRSVPVVVVPAAAPAQAATLQ